MVRTGGSPDFFAIAARAEAVRRSRERWAPWLALLIVGAGLGAITVGAWGLATVISGWLFP